MYIFLYHDMQSNVMFDRFKEKREDILINFKEDINLRLKK